MTASLDLGQLLLLDPFSKSKSKSKSTKKGLPSQMCTVGHEPRQKFGSPTSSPQIIIGARPARIPPVRI